MSSIRVLDLLCVLDCGSFYFCCVRKLEIWWIAVLRLVAFSDLNCGNGCFCCRMIDFRCRVCFETLIWFQRRGCSLGRVRRQVLFPVRRSHFWSLLDRSCEDYISHATESRYLTFETFVTHLGSAFLETSQPLIHISSLERSDLALLIVSVC